MTYEDFMTRAYALKGCDVDIPLGIDIDSNKVVTLLLNDAHPNLYIKSRDEGNKELIMNGIFLSLIRNSYSDDIDVFVVNCSGNEFKLFNSNEDLNDWINISYTNENVNKTIQTLKTIRKQIDNRKKIISSAGCINAKSYNDNSKDTQIMPAIVVIDNLEVLLKNNQDSYRLQELTTLVVDMMTDAESTGFHVILSEDSAFPSLFNEVFKYICRTVIIGECSEESYETLIGTSFIDSEIKKEDIIVFKNYDAEILTVRIPTVTDSDINIL